MSKSKINAKEVLEDLRAGFDDTHLMEKYNLSARGLQSLFKKLVETGIVDPRILEGERPQPGVGPSPGEREVSAKEVLKDLRSGMPQDGMMRKYRLSAKGLANLFEQLVGAGLIAESELDQGSLLENTVELTEEGVGEVMVKETTRGEEDTLEPSPTERREPTAPEEPVASDSGTTPTWQCPACNELVSGETDQCPKCGTLIAQFLAEQEKPFGDEPSISMEQTMELVWQCPGCGVRQYKAFDVCPECGLSGADYVKQTTDKDSGPAKEDASGKASEKGPDTEEGIPLSDRRRDPDIHVNWLKDELGGDAAEFRKRPYTKLLRLARALTWIAPLQLVVVIVVAVGRFLMVKSYGESTALALPALVIPALVSVLGYVLLRSVSEAIRMGIDVAHSLEESNRLLAQILETRRREER